MNNSAKIFLSHSSQDKEFVRKLAFDLTKNNVPVWFDEWELKVGDSLNNKIGDGIKESGWLGVIISSNSIKSSWVEKELNAGMASELEKKQVFVLPIVIENCEIPIFLRDKLFADFRADYSFGLKALLGRLIPDTIIISIKSQMHKSEIIKQQNTPKPEEYLLSIEDVKIVGRNNKYPGLFDVRFSLNKSPDEEWIALFNNPSTFSVSIHPAKVYDNEIFWAASEEDIVSQKHWIFDWLEDANKRYLPLITKRLQNAEERHRKLELENAKVAELETILKIGREGTPVTISEETIVGKCNLRLNTCTAQNNPGPIAQVNFKNQGYIHVCFDCLQKQIDSGKWIEN